MDITFKKFNQFLGEALKQELPGKAAQQEMLAKNRNGQKLNFKPSKSPRLGAVLISFYEKNNEIYFTLMKRVDYPGPHSGQIGIPGGKKEGDETAEENAIREANEEVGIDPDHLTILGQLSELYIVVSNFIIVPVIGFLKKPPKYKLQEEEVAYVIEVPLKEFLNPMNQREKEITTHLNFKLLAPYFKLQDEMVWGATAMMLNELRIIINGFLENDTYEHP